MLLPATFLISLIIIGSGAVNTDGNVENSIYQNPSCLPGYVFINGLCYNYNNVPQGVSTCPNGYVLRDNWCYPGCSACTYTTTTSTTPPILTSPVITPPTTTTTTRRPIFSSTNKPIPPDSNLRCPEGSVFTKGRCRKIVCPLGELINGQCFQITCPNGTVWNGHSCKEPGFITTIIEIENVILTEVNEKQGQVIRENNTNIEYLTEQPEVSKNQKTTSMPTTTFRPPNPLTEEGCCTIISPRICKKYGKKWVCFHRRVRRCNDPICKAPTIYLKTPQIVSKPPLLIMPPNPPLQACPTPNCDISDAVDCSGCVQNQRENCSQYCYSYTCPNGACTFLDLQDYCQLNPGEFECKKADGCSWDWCGER